MVSLALVSCDAPVGMGDASTGCTDSDGDGHGALACGGDDCDDTSASRHPDATEVCNGEDDDCNGLVDDGVDGAAEAPHDVIANVTVPTFVSLADATDGFVAIYGSASDVHGAWVVATDTVTPAQLVSPITPADPGRSLFSPTATMGCPDTALVPLAPAPCNASGACFGTYVCVTAPDGSRVCETPIVHNSPELPGECQTHAECQDGIICNGLEQCEPRADPSLVDARGCGAPPRSDPCGGMGRCDEAQQACIMPTTSASRFTEMSAGQADGAELLAVCITTDRCFSGRARPSLVTTTSQPWTNVLWGDDLVTTSWIGVDVASDGCTGASRPATEGHGASGVAVAALAADARFDRDAPEALAAWRAADATTTGPVPVEIVGLWREQYSAGAVVLPFADASGDAVPVRLPGATTSARIGVTSYTAGRYAGYVVAYASATGGAAVSALRAMGDVVGRCPGDPCLVREPGPDGLIGTLDDGAPTTSIPATTTTSPRTTPSLPTPTSSTVDTTSTLVGDVGVATGRTLGSTVDVALAFGTSTEIVVAMASVDAASGGWTDTGMRVHLPARSRSDLRIVHLEAGLANAGSFGSSTIATSETGGYVVTWTTATGTFAARISDATHDVLAPGVIRLGATSEAPMAFVDYDAAMSHPRARVAAHQGDAFVVFPSVCGLPG